MLHRLTPVWFEYNIVRMLSPIGYPTLFLMTLFKLSVHEFNMFFLFRFSLPSSAFSLLCLFVHIGRLNDSVVFENMLMVFWIEFSFGKHVNGRDYIRHEWKRAQTGSTILEQDILLLLWFSFFFLFRSLLAMKAPWKNPLCKHYMNFFVAQMQRSKKKNNKDVGKIFLCSVENTRIVKVHFNSNRKFI